MLGRGLVLGGATGLDGILGRLGVVGFPLTPALSTVRGKRELGRSKSKVGVDFDRPNTVGLARLMATAGENVIKYANTIN